MDLFLLSPATLSVPMSPCRRHRTKVIRWAQRGLTKVLPRAPPRQKRAATLSRLPFSSPAAAMRSLDELDPDRLGTGRPAADPWADRAGPHLLDESTGEARGRTVSGIALRPVVAFTYPVGYTQVDAVSVGAAAHLEVGEARELYHRSLPLPPRRRRDTVVGWCIDRGLLLSGVPCGPGPHVWSNCGMSTTCPS